MSSRIKKVPGYVNFPQLDARVLSFWKSNNIYKKSLDINKGNDVKSIYDGPITANGAAHHGHMLTFTLKDIIPRYWSMKGFLTPRSIGWDCQGLPVEFEVEKKLGFKDKKDIEKYGIEKFNQLCKESVLEYRKEIEELEEKMGRLTDKSEEYSTMDKDYIESIWWSLSELYKKGLLYEGFKVVPYSTRGGTTLSNAEVALGGYKSVTEKAVTVKFKLILEEGSKIKKITKGKDVFILAWTTTPWTLPTNFALAVGNKIEYSLVNKDGDIFVIASDLASKYFGEDPAVLTKVSGEDLCGLSYEPLFDYFLGRKNAFKIYKGFHVTTESGTGVVHLAPYGVEDNEIFRDVGIDSLDVLDEQGDFLETIPDLKGINYQEANSIIINKLEEKKLMFLVENYTHDLPFCWRTKTPLIYKPVTSWFIKTSSLRSELVENNNKINWIPSHVKEGRFGNWLEEIKDWSISRFRYWGTPLPVWKGEKTGKIIVFGSYQELENLTGKKVEDPHRPFIDEFSFVIEGEKYFRIKDVIDVWYDSGAMPFARFHYPFENNERFQSKFPADYIAEGIDQTRGWFYSLHAIGTALFGQNVFKNVVINGFVLDDKGEKLSKSKGNYSPPIKLLEEFGADAIRYNFCATPIVSGEDVTISPKTIKQTQQEVLIPLWNIFSYFTIYAEIHNVLLNEDLDEEELSEIDKWIVALVKTKANEVDLYLSNYNLQKATNACLEIINATSKWYIRINRSRIVGGDVNALRVLFFIIDNLIRLLAPIIPFVTEEIYQNLHRKVSDKSQESVHLTLYPTYLMNKNEEEKAKILFQEMKIVQEISSSGQNLRVNAGIKLRQPLGELILVLPNIKIKQELLDIIRAELNVKMVSVYSNIKDIPDHKAVKDKNAYIGTIDIVVSPDLSFSLFLDKRLTTDLKNEGLLTELKRHVQQQRKNQKLMIGENIPVLSIVVNNLDLADLLNANMVELKESLYALKIEVQINKELDKRSHQNESIVSLDKDNSVKISF